MRSVEPKGRLSPRKASSVGPEMGVDTRSSKASPGYIWAMSATVGLVVEAGAAGVVLASLTG